MGWVPRPRATPSRRSSPSPNPIPNPDPDPNQELCAKHGGEGSVAFVEHYPGNASGYVRFAAAAGATLALAALATSAEEVGGAVPSWRLLPEEEEVAECYKTETPPYPYPYPEP